jgi:hypothetical protein
VMAYILLTTRRTNLRLANRSSTQHFLFLVLVALPVAAASLTAGKPEEVGLSPDRLQRIHEMIQRPIDAGSISGAVTLVARKGRIAHLEAHGLMDIDSKKPMMPSSASLRCRSRSPALPS